MSDASPTSFNALTKDELYRSAVEDFALEVKKTDNKQTLLAAFGEYGVTWADYLKQHPELLPKEEEMNRTPEPSRQGSVISTQDMEVEPTPVVEEPAAGRVITYEPPKYNPNDKLLIKMERKNPMFQIRGYTFKKEAPYNLVSPSDAEFILRKPGFRQAFPSEVAEFYS